MGSRSNSLSELYQSRFPNASSNNDSWSSEGGLGSRRVQTPATPNDSWSSDSATGNRWLRTPCTHNDSGSWSSDSPGASRRLQTPVTNNDSFSSDSGVGGRRFLSPVASNDSWSRLPNRIIEASEASQDFEEFDLGHIESIAPAQITMQRDTKEINAMMPSPAPSTHSTPFSRLFRPHESSSMETRSCEETSSAPLRRLGSFFRSGRTDSDAVLSSLGRKLLFGRKRSDVSSMSLEDGDDEKKPAVERRRRVTTAEKNGHRVNNKAPRSNSSDESRK
jgi:hypothetical protein